MYKTNVYLSLHLVFDGTLLLVGVEDQGRQVSSTCGEVAKSAFVCCPVHLVQRDASTQEQSTATAAAAGVHFLLPPAPTSVADHACSHRCCWPSHTPVTVLMGVCAMPALVSNRAWDPARARCVPGNGGAESGARRHNNEKATRLPHYPLSLSLLFDTSLLRQLLHPPDKMNPSQVWDNPVSPSPYAHSALAIDHMPNASHPPGHPYSHIVSQTAYTSSPYHSQRHISDTSAHNLLVSHDVSLLRHEDLVQARNPVYMQLRNANASLQREVHHLKEVNSLCYGSMLT
jgi:hypothetical protein